MAATTAFRPRFAVLDTNILFHLAEQHAPAHNLVRRLLKLGFTPVVVQTVVQELGDLADNGDSQKKRGVATTALTSMRQWGIQPVGLLPVGNGICTVAADVIAGRGILPEEERNDAYIAIESSFCGAALLIMWDDHLLSAPVTALNEVLKSFDLNPIQIVHPRVILDRDPS